MNTDTSKVKSTISGMLFVGAFLVLILSAGMVI